MSAHTAKLFKNGHSQAVHLPADFRFDGKEVFIYKEGDKVILSPKPVSWDDFFDTVPQPPPLSWRKQVPGQGGQLAINL